MIKSIPGSRLAFPISQSIALQVRLQTLVLALTLATAAPAAASENFWRKVVEAIALVPTRAHEVADKDALCPPSSAPICWRLAVVLSPTCLIAPRFKQLDRAEAFAVTINDRGKWRPITSMGWGPSSHFVAAGIDPIQSSATVLEAGSPDAHYSEIVYVASYSAELQAARYRPARLSGFSKIADGTELIELQLEPEPGDIGGAVFSGSGQLLGMVIAIPELPSTVARLAVSVSTIRTATSGDSAACHWPAER